MVPPSGQWRQTALKVHSLVVDFLVLFFAVTAQNHISEAYSGLDRPKSAIKILIITSIIITITIIVVVVEWQQNVQKYLFRT